MRGEIKLNLPWLKVSRPRYTLLEQNRNVVDMLMASENNQTGTDASWTEEVEEEEHTVEENVVLESNESSTGWWLLRDVAPRDDLIRTRLASVL